VHNPQYTLGHCCCHYSVTKNSRICFIGYHNPEMDSFTSLLKLIALWKEEFDTYILYMMIRNTIACPERKHKLQEFKKKAKKNIWAYERWVENGTNYITRKFVVYTLLIKDKCKIRDDYLKSFHHMFVILYYTARASDKRYFIFHRHIMPTFIQLCVVQSGYTSYQANIFWKIITFLPPLYSTDASSGD